MPYSTPAMVRLALVPSSDGTLPAQPSGTAADLADAQLTDAIAEADSIIDGYLARRYTVPVAAVSGSIPHPVDYWSRNLAAYEASCTYRGSMDFSDNDPVARRYKATMDALKDVAAGRMTLDLPLSSGTDSTASSGVGAAVNPYNGDLWQPSDFDIRPSADQANTDGSAGLPYWRTPGGLI